MSRCASSTPGRQPRGIGSSTDADCYLSLHRADGGLGAVAKAMSWGTSTVVTATPASLEFQTDRDSGLVCVRPRVGPRR